MRMILLIFTWFALLLGCTNPRISSTAEPTGTAPTESSDYTFLLGTYTAGDSEGIYRYSLGADGSLRQLNLAAASSNPSYLVYAHDRQYVVAVNENDIDGTGTLESFRVEGDNLVPINQAPTGGANPCHVAVNGEGQVLVANYTGGNVGYARIDEDGNLSGLLDTQSHQSPEQEAHAHSVYFDANTNGVYAVDLGRNALYRYTLTGASTALEAASPPSISLDAEAGPRHLDFHPNGRWAYVINEFANTMTLLEHEDSGAFAKRASYSTLPPDFTGESFCADVHVSSDGRFVYGSNRGANTIVAFAIDEGDGSLQQIDQEPVRGDWPRNFSLSPDERYIVVANQRSDNVVSLRRDAESGELEYVGEVKAPSPVCVRF